MTFSSSVGGFPLKKIRISNKYNMFPNSNHVLHGS